MNSKKAVQNFFSKINSYRLYSLLIIFVFAATAGLAYSFLGTSASSTRAGTAAKQKATFSSFSSFALNLAAESSLLQNNSLALEGERLEKSAQAAASFIQEQPLNTKQLAAEGNATSATISNATGLNSLFVYDEDRGPLDFSVHVLGPGNGPTVFVVGGIQGDEPGAFSAASLLVTHYNITRGRLVVVPNLNFSSIINRNRGVNGDMNRKFAGLSHNDPEYETVSRIKNLLLSPHVDAILNLHDGSGFYRPDWEGPMRNPKRWGQSVIIDQASIGDDTYCQLEKVAENVLGRTNTQLLAPEHKYHLKNTRTSEGDQEMEKTLTFFAIRNGKPAFGIEASKDFPLPVRAYYHIQVLESFMSHMGIEFERRFEPTPEGVALALGKNIELTFADSGLTLNLDKVRSNLNHFPLKKGAKMKFSSSSPLVTVVESETNSKDLVVYYGNRPVTQIKPDYMDFDSGLQSLELIVDGKTAIVPLGGLVDVAENVEIKPVPGYRINAIGAQVNGSGSECNYPLKYADFEERFSIDKTNSVFRIEIYKENPQDKSAGIKDGPSKDSFAGAILVKYPVKTAKNTTSVLPGVEGRESLLGY